MKETSYKQMWHSLFQLFPDFFNFNRFEEEQMLDILYSLKKDAKEYENKREEYRLYPRPEMESVQKLIAEEKELKEYINNYCQMLGIRVIYIKIGMDKNKKVEFWFNNRDITNLILI